MEFLWVVFERIQQNDQSENNFFSLRSMVLDDAELCASIDKTSIVFVAGTKKFQKYLAEHGNFKSCCQVCLLRNTCPVRLKMSDGNDVGFRAVSHWIHREFCAPVTVSTRV